MEKGQRALYLFCFARSGLVGEIEGTGVDGHLPLYLFRPFPDLCAVVSEVPLEDFCGPAAELQMQELAWVGPRALRHEAVVEQVMRQSPVLPVRFGTLFSSQESLAEFLDIHRQTILQFLERVAGQEEWSIKGLLDRTQAGQALISASLAAQQGQLATLRPGTRYFQEQRIRSAAEKELSLWLNETCQQVASDLRKQASDFRECQVVPREAPESGTEVVLNWAFLLRRGVPAAFRLRIDRVNERYATRGLVFELSGPWPPYRFVPPLSMETAP
ncbi:MAG: GvpL/GvpF family gas vesicle protein [Terriglobia bacterium]